MTAADEEDEEGGFWGEEKASGLWRFGGSGGAAGRLDLVARTRSYKSDVKANGRHVVLYNHYLKI